MDTKFNKGQYVRQDFGGPIMTVVGFDQELIENVITQWEDDQATIITGKFMESILVLAEEKV